MPYSSGGVRSSSDGSGSTKSGSRGAPLALRRWAQLARKQFVGASARVADRVLDRGLHTAGNSELPEHSRPYRVMYVPSPWYALPRELYDFGVSSQDTFVDFGSGKGRVVHQAARWPFRRVIGVEVSPALAEIARAGLAARKQQHRCEDVEIVVADAAEFPIPDDLTIAYFFHPFVGETLDRVLRGLVESIDRNPRRVRLIYVCPIASSQVLATGRFRLTKERRAWSSDAPASRVQIFENSISETVELASARRRSRWHGPRLPSRYSRASSFERC